MGPSELSSQLQQVTREGQYLRAELSSWRLRTLEWSVQHQSDFQPNQVSDLRMGLAWIYYHAISIYLSGVFDYHSDVYSSLDISTPILSGADITQHVESLLKRVEAALCRTRLSGLLFLFPLRVAGARAFTEAHQQKVKGLLKLTSAQGLAASQAFIDDLARLWEDRSRRN